MAVPAILELSGGQFTTRRPRDPNGNWAAVAAPRPRARIIASHSRARTKADFARYRTHRWTNVIPQIFGIAVVLALGIGWLNRDDNGLTPVSGVGYWLGIAGSSLMLLLLLYPLRKRMPSLRVIGKVAFWFRGHMILGILGPVLVLWHSNFRLGSI